MWAKWAPEGEITSLHALDENEGQQDTYHCILFLETDMADKHVHSDTHGACEEVCLQGSCMIYVPYKQRYGEAAADCIGVD